MRGVVTRPGGALRSGDRAKSQSGIETKGL